MSLKVGDRVCVSTSDAFGGPLFGEVAGIGPAVEGIVTVDVTLDRGGTGTMAMPETALLKPWIPAPIRDPEALEQWLKA